MSGEGNIRGFVNQAEKGADAAISLSSELFMINKRINLDGYLENRRISLELALFTDGGISITMV